MVLYFMTFSPKVFKNIFILKRHVRREKATDWHVQFNSYNAKTVSPSNTRQYYTHQPQKNLKSLTQPGNQQTICQALCYVQI